MILSTSFAETLFSLGGGTIFCAFILFVLLSVLLEPSKHLQHAWFSSVSLKNGKGWGIFSVPDEQGQQLPMVEVACSHPGFSQTSSHFGLGHTEGLWHFQSHFGSSQTGTHWFSCLAAYLNNNHKYYYSFSIEKDYI